jgi:L-iditol 2-dehydrogenase
MRPETVEIKKVPVPLPADGEVLVRIRAALTCGTDLKAFLRGHPMIPMPGRFGHEFSGIIEATGTGVEGFLAGDEVMSAHTAPCLLCRYCGKGLYNLCENIMDTKILGAFAEFIIVPSHIVRQNMYIKPASLPFEEAALMEPLACVVHSMNSTGIRNGDAVLIIGSGPIGLLHLLLAKKRGARVIMTGLEPDRLELAKSLGAEYAVLPQMIKETVREMTSGLGVDAVFECTGQPAVWEAAPDYLRRGGIAVLFGGCRRGTKVSYDTYRIHYDEITLKGIFHFAPSDVKEAYDILCNGKLETRRLISGSYPLEKITEPFKRLSLGDGIKYAIIP